jgi:stage V sporulation protein D (sporulation-specific penicillin-binding protein)
MSMRRRRTYSKTPDAQPTSVGRIRIAAVLVLLVGLLIIVRLFGLMVLNKDYYAQLSVDSKSLLAQLFPERGSIFIQDTRNGEEFPVALNRDVFLLYADTREIDLSSAEDVAEKLSATLGYDDEQKYSLFLLLQKPNDPYEPIEKELEESVIAAIDALDLPGIYHLRVPKRYYPEGTIAPQLLGFVGKNEAGDNVGRYGIEGYWNRELAGEEGYFEGIRSGKGRRIPIAGKIFEPAMDGADLLLTVDRIVQFRTCGILEASMVEYGATSASAIVMNPKTGAILAMCSLPSFDPNTYNQVDNIEVYNNSSIFTPYEPGSIFKPIPMAAALNEGIVTPQSVYHDSGSIEAGCTKEIKNADGKVYDDQTMTGVLENSVNTGMVYVAQQLTRPRLIEYIDRFGFGVETGVALDTEVAGTVSTLDIHKGDEIDCYAATASFGQGITATPLQMVNAFSAIANGGTLMQPYVVSEVRHADGSIERRTPQEIRKVLDTRTARLTAGMLVNVVKSGHAGAAGVAGYHVGGKTGTAQIAGPGGYTEETNHSFVGFGPVDDPVFALIVKFEKPQRRFSASTAAPTFGNIASFLLQYYGVAPNE